MWKVPTIILLFTVMGRIKNLPCRWQRWNACCRQSSSAAAITVSWSICNVWEKSTGCISICRMESACLSDENIIKNFRKCLSDTWIYNVRAKKPLRRAGWGRVKYFGRQAETEKICQERAAVCQLACAAYWQIRLLHV